MVQLLQVEKVQLEQVALRCVQLRNIVSISKDEDSKATLGKNIVYTNRMDWQYSGGH